MSPAWLILGFWLLCAAAMIVGFLVSDWRSRRRFDRHTDQALAMLHHPGSRERIGPPMEWLP